MNKTGSTVAREHELVEVVEVADKPVAVDVDTELALVVALGEPQNPLWLTAEASMRTRGNPDAIGTAMFPLVSTVIDVQVYTSTSFVLEVYPLPLRVKVYELPDAPRFDNTVMT